MSLGPNEVKTIESLMRAVGAYQVKMQFSDEWESKSKSTGIDIVTSVDIESEKRLVKGLLTLLPGSAVLAEESGRTGGATPYTWVIDPLDGTTNYAQGLPLFAISVALLHHQEAVFGAIYCPMLNQFYHAVLGQGAWLEGKRLRVSSKLKLSDAVVATGFPYDRSAHPQNNVEEATKIIPLVRGLRRMGVASLDLALLASGALDAYWEYNLSPWDVAAGQLMVKEAGGVVSPLDARGISIVAGNPIMHDVLIQTLGLKVAQKK